MSLLSSFRKNKQEDPAEDSAFYSRAESATQAVKPRKRRTTLAEPAAGAKAPVDPVLPEKKRARRRLVGAVALVLAVVIGLPMVLDSEPKPLADDVTIEIPSRDKPVPASKPSADKPGKPAGSRVPAAAALDQKEEVVDLPASAEKTHDRKIEKPAEKASEKASGKTADKVTDRTTEKAAVRSAERAAEKTAEAAAATKAPEAADARASRYTVQVAAFASMEKVNEVRGRLKDAGIASYTQKVATGGGERIRIRVGPMNGRQEAERMRARLAILGLSGTLVPVHS